jgi:hypothetical protein
VLNVIRLEQWIKRELKLEVDLHLTRTRGGATYYESDKLPPSNDNWFDRFITSVQVKARFWDAPDNTDFEHGCDLQLRYEHGDLSDAGSNSVSVSLFQHRDGEWYTRNEVLKLHKN